MARPARPWFRFYVETFGDRKIRRLSPTQRWIWAAVLGAARESPEPGRLFVAEGVPMTDQELADYAAVAVKQVRPALVKMAGLGMIAGLDDVIKVVNWDSRQFESDDVTPRVKRSRERAKTVTRN